MHTLNCFVCRGLRVRSHPVAEFITLLLWLIGTSWGKIKLLHRKRSSSWGTKTAHFSLKKKKKSRPSFGFRFLLFSSLIKTERAPFSYANDNQTISKCKATKSSTWVRNMKCAFLGLHFARHTGRTVQRTLRLYENFTTVLSHDGACCSENTPHKMWCHDSSLTFSPSVNLQSCCCMERTASLP